MTCGGTDQETQRPGWEGGCHRGGEPSPASRGAAELPVPSLVAATAPGQACLLPRHPSQPYPSAQAAALAARRPKHPEGRKAVVSSPPCRGGNQCLLPFTATPAGASAPNGLPHSEVGSLKTNTQYGGRSTGAKSDMSCTSVYVMSGPDFLELQFPYLKNS